GPGGARGGGRVSIEAFGFLIPHWRDVVEILLVAFVIYRLLLFLVGTRAIQILVGLIFLGIAYVAAYLLKFTMITYLLTAVFTYGVFAAIVVFQPELRSALARLGQSRFMRFLSRGERSTMAEEVAEAVDRLARTATGAIVAVEGDIGLDEYIPSGNVVQAKVSASLLTTIFTPYSPLHDGAVLIRGDQIIGAGCILPLTQFPVTDKSLGTRHRAAIGLSEETDATVVVVSEETSTISMAQHGLLYRNLTPPQIHDLLAGTVNRLEGGERVTSPRK
ncbi:MAG: diadenylate cyclase CdaA, partial [Gemmatimonadales bacterium]